MPAPARRTFNRAASPPLAHGLPWLSIALASLIPGWFTMASAPVLPPFGFMMLLAWTQLRPGVLPVWVGLPLGAFDDLFSGQPIGSGILLWSASTIILDLIEQRLPWRDFVTEWLMAVLLIAAYILACSFVNMAFGAAVPIAAMGPQIVLSMLAYPIVGRIVAGLDRLRLKPVRLIR